MSRHDRTIAALLGGTASSLLAAAIASLSNLSPAIVASVLAAATLLLLAHSLSVRRRFQILHHIGLLDWEQSMSEGTTTEACIRSSHASVRFMGIAGSKWLADSDGLRQMLKRHSSNGGQAEFLLLDPDSDACRRFELIKNRPPGSLAARIRQNAAALNAFQLEHHRVYVRFYDVEPRFRVAIIDGATALIGLYSFTSEAGDDTPQLVFESKQQPWSFFYGFNAYFLGIWEHAHPVRTQSGPQEATNTEQQIEPTHQQQPL